MSTGLFPKAFLSLCSEILHALYLFHQECLLWFFFCSFRCLNNQVLSSLTICWRRLFNCVCIMLLCLSGMCCSFSPYKFCDVLSKLVSVDEISSASVFSACTLCAMALLFQFLLYILQYTAICSEENPCILQRIAAPYRGLLKHSSCCFRHQVLSHFLVLFVFRRPCAKRTLRII